MIDLIERHANALPDLCRRHAVVRLELFGSAATGRFDASTSDLDFLVAFEDLPPVAYSEAYFGLKAALELLYGRSVDLVTTDSLRNPYFRESVDRTRECVYGT